MSIELAAQCSAEPGPLRKRRPQTLLHEALARPLYGSHPRVEAAGYLLLVGAPLICEQECVRSSEPTSTALWPLRIPSRNRFSSPALVQVHHVLFLHGCFSRSSSGSVLANRSTRQNRSGHVLGAGSLRAARLANGHLYNWRASSHLAGTRL